MVTRNRNTDAAIASTSWVSSLNDSSLVAPSQQASDLPAPLHVPPGHLLATEKWRNSVLTANLKGNVSVVYVGSMGIVDFQTSSHTGVIYISESDLIIGVSLKKNLVKLRMTSGFTHGVVICEKTPVSAQYFSKIQKFVVLKLGLVLHPVLSETEAAELLSRLVLVASSGHKNPFLVKHNNPPLQMQLMKTLMCIPSLGEVNARALLEHFRTIEAIANATPETLASIIGKSRAQQVFAFFRQKIT